MIDYEKEAKLSGLAVEAAEKTEGASLSHKVAKIAKREGLNKYEIQELCARTNHLVNSKMAQEDKLAVFKIAKIEEVEELLKPKQKKQAYNMYTAEHQKPMAMLMKEETPKPKEDKGAPLRKLANMLYPQEDQYAYDEHGNPVELNIEEAGDQGYFPAEPPVLETELAEDILDVEDRIEESQYRINTSMEKIYQIARNLIMEGTPPEEMIETLNSTVLRDYPGMQDFIVTDVIRRLQEEGLIPAEQQYDTEQYPPLDEAYVKESALTKLSSELSEHIENYGTLMGQQALMLDKMAGDFGYKKIPYYIHRKFERMASDIIKKEAKMLPTEDMLANIAAKTTGLAVGSILGPLALSGVSSIANKVRQNVRRRKADEMKDVLPERYPDLKNIPYPTYSDIYDTVTETAPSLVNTPYALYQIVKGQAAYGTMDLSTMALLAKAEKDMQTKEVDLLPKHNIGVDISAEDIMEPREKPRQIK